MDRLPETELKEVVQRTGCDVFRAFRDSNIFISGGTGFIGKWLLESLLFANGEKISSASITVLTRDVDRFLGKHPSMGKCPGLSFLEGDLSSFPFHDDSFHYIIHAAADFGETLSQGDPLRVWESTVDGTRRMLRFAGEQKGLKSFLFVSSGAVYGKQPPDLPRMGEDFSGELDQTAIRNIYGLSKRAAETLCSLFHCEFGLPVKIARCFALVGPYLPLDRHYAAGDFIRDGLCGRNIEIGGNGLSVRSYMYAGDLAVWLFTILVKGRDSFPYNVGSDLPVSIRELAGHIADCFRRNVVVSNPSDARLSRYVPSTGRASEDLGLSVAVDLKTAIRRTIDFYAEGGIHP